MKWIFIDDNCIKLHQDVAEVEAYILPIALNKSYRTSKILPVLNMGAAGKTILAKNLPALTDHNPTVKQRVIPTP